MDLPEDDVGIELMNAKFSEMGILVADEDGYQVAPEFLERIEKATAKQHGDLEIGSPEHRLAIRKELDGMGVPAGFEDILTNWIVHALRSRDW